MHSIRNFTRKWNQVYVGHLLPHLVKFGPIREYSTLNCVIRRHGTG